MSTGRRWRRETVVFALVVAAVAGCAQAPQPAPSSFETARAQARAAEAACHSDHLVGLLKTNLDEARCIRGKVVPIFAEAGYPNMDLVHLYMAAKEVAAKKQDMGRVSAAKAETQLQELNARIHAEEQRRAAAKEPPGQSHANNDSLLAGLDALTLRAQGRAAKEPKAPPKTSECIYDCPQFETTERGPAAGDPATPAPGANPTLAPSAPPPPATPAAAPRPNRAPSNGDGMHPNNW